MGMSQLRIIFYMGAMNKMLEFIVTHGKEHRECRTLHSSSKQLLNLVCIIKNIWELLTACFFLYISATEKLVIEAQEKGEQHINIALNYYLKNILCNFSGKTYKLFLNLISYVLSQWVSTHPSSALYSCCVCSHVLWLATLWTGRWRNVKTQSKSMCSESCAISSVINNNDRPSLH